MARISAAIIVVCLATFLLVNNGESKSVEKREIETLDWNSFLQSLCQQGLNTQTAYICNGYTSSTTTSTSTTTTSTSSTSTSTTPESEDNGGKITSSSTSTSTSTSTTTTATSTDASSTTELSASALERAHWCQFQNGSYLALAQTFIYDQCYLCQCITSRAIRCASLQCMATYCIDGSTPYVPQGHCCQQCGYDNASTSCVVNGVTYPHGVLLSQTTDNIQCWCELGTVECRKSTLGAVSSSDVWSNGTGVYIVVIIIIALLLFGLLVGCGCGCFYYYFYYNKTEQTLQEGYGEYYSNAGWQPMSEDGQVVVDEKQAEAQAQQFAEYPIEQSLEQVPPAYGFNHTSVINK